MRDIDLKKERNRIVDFIKNYIHDSGFKNGILGISGGLDSSVVAYLAADALGKENVIGIMMPYKTTKLENIRDAYLIIKNLRIKSYKYDISPMVDHYYNTYEKNADRLRRGNMMARLRMCILYDLSAKEKALVIGTGNKTELNLGYVTQHGDAACAFEPIGHLYKTEVKKLAKIIDIPKKILQKTPSADLWKGQTDEKELGITYKKADLILYYILDKNLSDNEISQKGFSIKEINHIKELIKKSEFKRTIPLSLY